MSLQTSLELGNYPVSSCSVRLHHIAIDLRKRPVGRRPAPSFPAPRAIPKPLHSRSHVPIRTGRADDPITWPAIQIAGSALGVNPMTGRVGVIMRGCGLGGQLRTFVRVRSGRGPLIWHARAPIPVCGPTARMERSEPLAGVSRPPGAVPDIDPRVTVWGHYAMWRKPHRS